MIDYTFIALTVFDSIGAIIIFCGLCSDRLRAFPAWHKIGMMLIIIGLMSQLFRNITFFITGVSPADNELPLWTLKDYGIDIIAMQYAIMALERFIDSNKAQPKTPTPRTRTKPNETSTNKPTTSVRKRSTSNSNKT
jgi:hypothetical protein